MPEKQFERRSFPRPPLWLNLLLLLLGVAGMLVARQHRERVSKQFAHVIAAEQRTPADIRKIKEELAEMDLTREALKSELEGRMKFVNSLKSEDFYISVDTSARKLRFYYGGTVLREGDITIGEGRAIESGGKKWTFVPVKGAFPVEGMVIDHPWRVPEWVYAMNGQPVPASLPVVTGGLGKYVLFLTNGYVIHSPPVEGGPLQGAKPASIMVSEADLSAIWERVHRGKTQVYIY